MRIAIGHSEIGRVMAGEQTLFIRPAAGAFRKIAPGAQLWLAEPFYLPHSFAHLAPTAARDRGARPAFAADWLHAPAQVARTHGPRLPARSLCKEWHRAHLVVLERTELRLHDLGPDELAGLGFRSPAAFAGHWNLEMGLFSSRGHKWHDNPLALLFRFELVHRPLPAAAAPDKPPVRGRPAPARAAPARAAPAAVPTPPPPPPPPPPPVRQRAASIPVHAQPAITGKPLAAPGDDKAFLAALRREQPSGHTRAAADTGPTRPRSFTMPPPANGTCPRCGTRLAFGCAHFPLQESAA